MFASQTIPAYIRQGNGGRHTRMAAPLYFISDLHFHIHRTEQDAEKLRRLRLLFRGIRDQQGRLYIVGDLFDFWFEYRYAIPREHFDLLVMLHDLVRSGVEIHYMAGNHDYWVDSFFREDLGIAFHADPIEVIHDGKRFWLCHGDGIFDHDRAYRVMKRMFRHPFIIRLFRWIHPDLGFRIARMVASTSRKFNKFEPQRSRELVERAYAEYAMPYFHQGYDYVIMGHFHHPFQGDQNGRRFLNLGDWMRFYSFAVFQNRHLELNYFTPGPFDEAPESSPPSPAGVSRKAQR